MPAHRTPLRDLDLISPWYGLGLKIFKSSPNDFNVQTRLRTTTLVGGGN